MLDPPLPLPLPLFDFGFGVRLTVWYKKTSDDLVKWKLPSFKYSSAPLRRTCVFMLFFQLLTIPNDTTRDATKEIATIIQIGTLFRYGCSDEYGFPFSASLRNRSLNFTKSSNAP